MLMVIYSVSLVIFVFYFHYLFPNLKEIIIEKNIRIYVFQVFFYSFIVYGIIFGPFFYLLSLS